MFTSYIEACHVCILYIVHFTAHQERKMVRIPIFWAGDAIGHMNLM